MQINDNNVIFIYVSDRSMQINDTKAFFIYVSDCSMQINDTRIIVIYFAVVGSTCSSNTDCVSIANAECVGSPLQCTCSSGHVSSGDGTTCNQISMFIS